MLSKIRHFMTSPFFLPIPLVIGLIGLLGGDILAIISMLTNVFLLTLVLFLSDDLLPALLPAFCIITVGVTLLERLTVVIPYIPFAFPVAIAFVFHKIRYCGRPRLGLSFWGLVITSVAIWISGIGTPLASRDYSSLAAIYHLIGLSVGLLALYLLFAMKPHKKRSYDPIHYFMACLSALGLLCFAIVFDKFLEWLIPLLTEALRGTSQKINWSLTPYLSSISYRNTISTLAVMCLPSSFYLAKQSRHIWSHILCFLMGIVVYIGAALTMARTALLFGTLLLAICVVYYLWGKELRLAKGINMAVISACLIVALLLFWEPITSFLDFRLAQGWLSAGEARVDLLIRSFEDFRAHPWFGIGITSIANSDVYSATGCIGWYHLYFPQIWGSMGVFGMIAYTVQFVLRAKLVFFRPDRRSLAMGLVYLGLFLYSQTDPGEFAPIPYAVLTVPLFLLLEERKREISDES